MEWVQERMQTLEAVNKDNSFKNICFERKERKMVAGWGSGNQEKIKNLFVKV